MFRCLLIAIACTQAVFFGWTGLTVAVAPSTSGPTSPVSPEESLRWFELDPEFQIELIASEPMVVDPVAIQFDERGRLWVVEMRDYPNGPAQDLPGTCCIKILEDADSDGHFDRSVVFADRLLFATGIQPYLDGAIVTLSGRLVFFRDSNNDGRSDTQEPWLTGLAEENPQLRANDPAFGLDLKLYLANGLRSRNLQTTAAKLPTTLDVRNRDVRVDPSSGIVETITGPSQFGMTWDRFGNRYFCSNRNPCDAVLVEQDEVSLSPLSGLAPIAAPVVPAGDASKVHPLTDAWTTSNLHAGQFSAACGVLVAASSHLLSAAERSDNRQAGFAFTCEPTGNLVHRRKLKRIDGRTEVSDPPPEKEFLASRDGWFRPVNLCEGPDGAVYVVDMYRAVIEHPQFMPEELKHRPDLRLGDDRGRIYRVSRRSSTSESNLGQVLKTLRAKPISERATGEQLALLAHADEWFRSTAARLLSTIESPDKALVEQAIELTRSEHAIETRMRAANLLARWNRLDEQLIETWLSDKALPMRIVAWRFLSEKSSPSLATSLSDHWKHAVASSEREERLEACWAVAKINKRSPSANHELSSLVSPVCAALVGSSPGDGHLWMACSAAAADDLAGFSRQVVLELMSDSSALSTDEKAVQPPISDAVERLVQAIAVPDSEDWKKLRTDTLDLLHAPSGLADSQRLHRLAVLCHLLNGWAKSKDSPSLGKSSERWQVLLETARLDRLPTKTRGLVVSTLAHAGTNLATPILKQLVETPNVEPTLYTAAVKAWSKHVDPTFDDWLVDQFKQSTLKRRDELFVAMLSSESRADKLIGAMESGTLPMKSLNPTQLQSLKNIRYAKLKTRVGDLVAKSIDVNREKVIAEYMACLDMKADLQRGRDVFTKQCASCHKLESAGVNVGPDISDSRKYTPSQLLTSILDPNRAIDNNYFRFVALTIDGEVCEGILTEETGKTVTLRGQNDKVHVLERSEIETIKSAGVSLMPEGLEAQIPPQAMADLIHYIKSWRYADGKIPAVLPK